MKPKIATLRILLAIMVISSTLNLSSRNLAYTEEKPKYQLLNLTIELDKVDHLYGCVGDYVNHWFQIGDDLYDIGEKAKFKVNSNQQIILISTTCDCNEKLVDRDDEELIIKVNKLKTGENRIEVKTKVHETRGKYAGNSAEYRFYYKITLLD